MDWNPDKPRTPEQSKHYSDLYNRASGILKMHNPCQIQVEGGKVSCAGTYSNLEGLCCNGCKHLGPTGCTVEALGCKVWLCRGIAAQFPEADKQLEDLRQEGLAHGVYGGCRQAKEELGFEPPCDPEG